MLQFLVKTSSRKGATMIELIAMMTIMGLWISSMLGVIGSGANFAKDTEDTIKAINLAREWIEWVTNWRNTNWLRFSSDKTNCWKVLNYVSSCIGNTGGGSNITDGSYLIYTLNWAWYLSGTTSIDYSTSWLTYKSTYKSWLDANWFYTQTWATVPTIVCSSTGQTNCMTPFTREIQVTAVWTGTLSVTSIVRWQAKTRSRDVTLSTTLTNWKAKF